LLGAVLVRPAFPGLFRGRRRAETAETVES
jgi:hypothetical protein